MQTRAALLALVLAKATASSAHEPTFSRFNYQEHVRPLFLRHCAGCHRASGAGPMSLLEYQEAVPWANAIKLALLDGRMPPFLPNDDSGPFQDPRAVTAVELDTIVDWAVGATPEGPSAREGEGFPAPSPLDADLLLRAASDVVLDEGEREKTACLHLPTGLDEARLVTGLEVFPGTPSILRRAEILVGESCSDGEPLATWLPDQRRVSFPRGFGSPLARSSNLLLDLHYVKGWGEEGKRIADRSSLGLWFSKDASPIRTVVIEKRRELDQAVRLLALYATPEGVGPLSVEAVWPDGATKRLLSIERFDPAWNEKYFFETPVLLPKGSALRVSNARVWADVASP